MLVWVSILPSFYPATGGCCLRFRAKASGAGALVLVLAFTASADLVSQRKSKDGQENLRIRDKDRDHDPGAAVRHLGKNSQGKEVAESKHFRIIHGQNRKLVEKIIREAEHIRPSIHRQWFGDVSLECDGKVLIYLHDSAKLYADKTKQWNVLGHARTLMLGDQISLRSVHLPWGVPNFFEDLMPHELTHAVMAVRFQGRPPRRAHDGMALVAQTLSQQERARSP